jgi:hypothetical protein
LALGPMFLWMCFRTVLVRGHQKQSNRQQNSLTWSPQETRLFTLISTGRFSALILALSFHDCGVGCRLMLDATLFAGGDLTVIPPPIRFGKHSIIGFAINLATNRT